MTDGATLIASEWMEDVDNLKFMVSRSVASCHQRHSVQQWDAARLLQPGADSNAHIYHQ